MNYEIKDNWMVPTIGESFVVLNDGVPVKKVMCVACVEGDNCDKCVFNHDVCFGSDINMTPFVCEHTQRPDGKEVYFKLIETY